MLNPFVELRMYTNIFWSFHSSSVSCSSCVVMSTFNNYISFLTMADGDLDYYILTQTKKRELE